MFTKTVNKMDYYESVIFGMLMKGLKYIFIKFKHHITRFLSVDLQETAILTNWRYAKQSLYTWKLIN